ncbi:fimbrial protein [Salmonella enterica subsp. enterica serovar Bareilly]
MKKTLIALAVAASAVVSGSAMAWVPQTGNFNGSIELGGTLSPVEKQLPWDVQTGTAVNDLSGTIIKSSTSASITVNKDIPVLGIRNHSNNGFVGGQGITPQVDYKNAVNVDGFSNGMTTLTLDVNDAQANNKIGTMTVRFMASAVASNTNSKQPLIAPDKGNAFFGGIGKSGEAIIQGMGSAEIAISRFFPDVFDTFGVKDTAPVMGYTNYQFDNGNFTYYGFYGSGIPSDSVINITLDAPAAAGDIAWKASLPVTVSYM